METFEAHRHGMSRAVSSGQFLLQALLLVGLLLPPPGASADTAKKTVVPKWGRFEREFKSSTSYANPLQTARLTVEFTSPLGEKFEADGFWDGGRSWKVRFCPDQPGRWTYRASCSDQANLGLNGPAGEFLCSAPVGRSRFHQHGPVRLARDERHFEHADGTPFFWLADTVWTGAVKSTSPEWDFYAQTRTAQGFTVAQWKVSPGSDSKSRSALTGFPDQIGIDPGFFQELDAKLATLGQLGVLSAIVPLSELESDVSPLALPDDQLALVVRYMAARWSADPVVWMLAIDGDAKSTLVARWKQVGQSVFGGRKQAPVIVYSSQSPWLLDEFRGLPWVNGLSLPVLKGANDDALKYALAGPFAQQVNQGPARPLIAFAPEENGAIPQTQTRFSSADARRGAWWGLLLANAAGVSYAGDGVVRWDPTVDTQKESQPGADLKLWQKAMFMPAAKQAGILGRLMVDCDFWRLRPAPQAVATQPGSTDPARQILAATTPDRSLLIAYLSEEKTVELSIGAIPPAPVAIWLNPRTGETSTAVGNPSGQTAAYAAPGSGDWVLVIRAGR
jgi:hypothetical protein